jgi:hypothetical protein
MTHSPRTFYRVLVRIESVGTDSLTCVVLSWNWREKIEVPLDTLPGYMREFLDSVGKLPCRVHAMVNMLETDKDKLRFQDWETS